MEYEIFYKSFGAEYSTGYGSDNREEAETVCKWLSGVMHPYNFYIKKGREYEDGRTRVIPAAMFNN